jgi:hypothetical protein
LLSTIAGDSIMGFIIAVAILAVMAMEFPTPSEEDAAHKAPTAAQTEPAAAQTAPAAAMKVPEAASAPVAPAG